MRHDRSLGDIEQNRNREGKRGGGKVATEKIRGNEILEYMKEPVLWGDLADGSDFYPIANNTMVVLMFTKTKEHRKEGFQHICLPVSDAWIKITPNTLVRIY